MHERTRVGGRMHRGWGDGCMDTRDREDPWMHGWMGGYRSGRTSRRVSTGQQMAGTRMEVCSDPRRYMLGGYGVDRRLDEWNTFIPEMLVSCSRNPRRAGARGALGLSSYCGWKTHSGSDEATVQPLVETGDQRGLLQGLPGGGVLLGSCRLHRACVWMLGTRGS